MRVVAAILCAGQGTRFGSDKVQVELNNKPIWLHSFEAFLNHSEVDAVALIASESNLKEISSLASASAFCKIGGNTRTESSRIAVESWTQHLEPEDILLIHDGARPFVSTEVISAVIAGCKAAGAAGPAIAVTDTIRYSNQTASTPDRKDLRAMQTPQGARFELLAKAYERLQQEVTDELQALELADIPFTLVEGDPKNRKITRREDLPMQSETRIGLGYDIHSFSSDPDRVLWLGGVAFEGHPALEGHSDADVLLHSVVDAILGAAGLGDIGVHFPPSDPQWKNCPSIRFLTHAGSLITQQGWRIVNIDVSVIAESPKIMSRADEMRDLISKTLNLESSCINVKATTNEKLGAIGRSEGIASFATASIARSFLG